MIAAAALVAALFAADAAPPAMQLGVNTHFDQNWPRTALTKVAEASAPSIRDTVTWGKAEVQPGIYRFTDANSGYVDSACQQGLQVLLMIAPRNDLYDAGMAVFSPAGQRALGQYIGALVDRFPCVTAIEVGNEINTASTKWPLPAAKPAMYVSMLRAVRAELNTRSRRVALLGGSSIGVSVPFHKRLFAAGELAVIDGVAVHPYIDNPDLLPGQLARLQQAMLAFGVSKPIWATEFGNYYKTPDAAPPHALKVITVMSAAGIDHAFWYALLDEPWFPNMGLFTATGPKPALATFQLAVRTLLAAGNARALPSADLTAHVYRYGQGSYVMWGNGTPIHYPAGARAFDAAGRTIALPPVLTPQPIVVTAAGDLTVG